MIAIFIFVMLAIMFMTFILGIYWCNREQYAEGLLAFIGALSLLGIIIILSL